MITTKPILFSAKSIIANEAGIKTQTRRIMNPKIKPCEHYLYEGAEWKDQPTEWVIRNGYAYCALCGNGVGTKNNYRGIKSPYQVGDICWVREVWGVHQPDNGNRPAIICGKDGPHIIHKKSGFREPVIHKAGKENYAWGMYGPPKWKSPRFMPKTAARYWVKITGIKVERLQDISQEDAKAEGCSHSYHRPDGEACKLYTDNNVFKDCYVCSFKTEWNILHGPNGNQWDTNPWVWVYDYELTEKPNETRN